MSALPKFLAFVRLSLGWIFLWAFVDKLFGLGFATKPENAWLNGGSPTTGFLSKAVDGPFAGFFHSLAGVSAVDWLFMLGLAGVGIALILGIALRLAAIAGVTMLLLMFLALSLPPDNNPILDEHLVYAGLLVGVALLGPGAWAPASKWWAGLALVKKIPLLR